MSAARGPPDIEPEGVHLITLLRISTAVGTVALYFVSPMHTGLMSINSALLQVPNAGAGVENIGTAWTGKARADTDKDANELYTTSPVFPASLFRHCCQELPNKLPFSLTTKSFSLSTRLQTWFAHSQLPLLHSMRSHSVLV